MLLPLIADVSAWSMFWDASTIKVYVPYFICDSAVEPIKKLGIPYEFYHINKDYRIIDEIRLNDGEALLYANYWGCKTHIANILPPYTDRGLFLITLRRFIQNQLME